MANPLCQPIHVDTLYDYRLMLADGRPVLGVIGGGHEQPFTAQEKMAIAAHAVACWNTAAALEVLAKEVQRLQRAVEYYRAGQEQRAPKWVPSKVWLAGPVRGDYPIGHTTIANEGEYDCESNRYGAVSVVAENGQWLGVKPCEFEPVEWRENTPDAARECAP